MRWLEEPVYWFDDRRGMRAVRLAAGLPVTAGQSEISEWGCRDLVELDAALAAGFRDVIEQPFQFDVLEKQVRALLEPPKDLPRAP